MEMHQVRYFLAVCAERNFTRAAKRCGVAQPSLTRAIGLLEEELGGPLFIRAHAGSELTTLGRCIYPYLARIERCLGEAGRAAKDFAKPSMGNLITRPEVVMRKIGRLAAVVVATLTLGVVLHLTVSAGGKPPAQVATTISPYDLQLATDVAALPTQEVKEPF